MVSVATAQGSVYKRPAQQALQPAADHCPPLHSSCCRFAGGGSDQAKPVGLPSHSCGETHAVRWAPAAPSLCPCSHPRCSTKHFHHPLYAFTLLLSCVSSWPALPWLECLCGAALHPSSYMWLHISPLPTWPAAMHVSTCRRTFYAGCKPQCTKAGSRSRGKQTGQLQTMGVFVCRVCSEVQAPCGLQHCPLAHTHASLRHLQHMSSMHSVNAVYNPPECLQVSDGDHHCAPCACQLQLIRFLMS